MSTPINRLVSLTAVALAAAALTACQPQLATWTPAETAHQPTVEKARASETFFVERTSGELAPGEAERLERFLASFGDTYSLHVRLSGPQPVERLQPLAGDLAIAGVPTANVTLNPDQASIPGLPGAAAAPTGPRADVLEPVVVTVDRYLAVLPGCPDWTQANADYGNQGTSFLGCANHSNLGAMVADPRDLTVGRSSGEVDGEVAATAVTNYRADKVKKLPVRSGTFVLTPAE